MNSSQKVLSDIIVYNKYAKYRPDLKRRETYEEIVDRYIGMMLKKYTDEQTYSGWLEKSVMVDKDSLAEQIIKNSKYLYEMKVLPSMRAMQFAGPAIEKNNARIFNCSYLPVDDYRAFSEIMFLLLGGSGVGYSVQYHHVEKLPEIQKPSHTKKFLIGDSIEGWADAIRALMKSYFGISKYKPNFDFSDIRPKGSRLVTAGGKAPGPEPLRICLTKIEALLNEKRNGSRLSPIEVHDIICYIADAVLAGGIRRAALISLFSFDDVEMATCKHGAWWELNPQRGRSNNSAVIVRNRIKKEEFDKFWKTIKDSNSGEPGIFFTNDSSRFGTNPCKPLRSTILTAEGYITFEEALTKNELEIITPDGRKAKASKPFVTGINKEIYEITLGNKQKIHATDNHLHQLLSGEWIPVSELNIGDKLKIGQTQIYDTIIENQDEYNKGLIHGWMLGDGWSYIRSDSINSYRSGLSFGIKEFDVIPMFEKILNSNSYPHEQKPDTCKLLRVNQKQVIYKDKWNVPFKESSSYKLGFIRSLFTTDGSVRNKNNNVELYSINIKMLEDVSLILQEFGIQSSITTHNKQRSYIAKDGKRRNNKTTYKINVYGGQFKKIGFLSKYKQELLDQQVLKKDYEPRDYEIVTNIEYIGNENVYDITVYDPCHSFIDKGIIAHNCAEISLREFSFCVSGDTKLITRNGIEQIDSVVDKEVEIWNGEQWSKVKPYKTGESDRLHRVHFSDGSYLDATDDHKFLVKNRFEKEFHEVTTLQLQDELVKSEYALQIPRSNVEYQDGYTDSFAYEYGYVLGDGTVYKNMIYADLYGKDNLIKLDGDKYKPCLNYNGTQYTRISFNKQLDIDFTKELKYELGLPKKLFTWDRQSILKFIAGWADADGSQASKGIRIYGREDKIRDGQLLLTKCGINSSVNLMEKEGIETNLGIRKNAVWYLQITKTIDIPCQRLICNNEKEAKYKGKYQIVKRIDTLDGEHKSYCLTENNLHQCVFNNVLTKQCNLTEINAGTIESQEDFNERARVASFFGTLQAGFTDFHYLRSVWKTNTEKDSLIGVGITGIANGNIMDMDLVYPADIVKEENARVAELIGINPAARTTTVKPAGTTSSLLGVSSGIHAWHSKKYIRNIQCSVGDDLYIYFYVHHPELVKPMDYQPGSAVIGIPIEAPSSAITREEETATDFLDRVKRFNLEWVRTGHNKGPNYNNVSATCNIKDEEWEEVGEWMWINKDTYSGISVLPYDGGTYVDAPFQEVTEEEFERRVQLILENPIDLTRIVEDTDNTNLSGEIACSGGQCELILF